MERILIDVCGLLLASGALAVGWQWPAPDWAVEALVAAGVDLTASADSRFVVANHVNPLVLFGDFDGDHRTDVAILVRARETSKTGIAIALRTGRVDVLGAGNDIGNGGDDFAWLDHWFTYTFGSVPRGADGGDPPVLRGDALFVEKSESASGILYFDGARYAWYQQAD